VKITKKHKIYLGVVGLGLLCLLGDRLIFAGDAPGGADGEDLLIRPTTPPKKLPDTPHPKAAPAATPTPTAAAAAAPKAEETGPSPGTAEIVKRLQTIAADQSLSTGEIRDAFKPAPAWVAAAASDKTGGAGGAGSKSVETSGQRFAKKHQLTAVVLGRGGGVLVDGKFLRIGQSLDGFKLTAVEQRSATFASEQEQVKLELAEEPTGKSP
jgi:hypothetical protein